MSRSQRHTHEQNQQPTNEPTFQQGQGEFSLTISIFKKKPIQKDSAFESEVIARLESLQNSEARSRQDTRQIVREELRNILNERNKRAFWSIA